MFDVFIERVLGHEGGYSRHPDDPGAATNWGITQRTAARHGYKGDMRYLKRDEAIRIYELEYWRGISGDKLPRVIAFQVFDGAVNSGIARSSQWLQGCLGVIPDGEIGAITIAAAKRADPVLVAVEYNHRRLEFYSHLPIWPAFGKGWSRRVAGNLKYILEDNAAVQTTA